VGVLARLCSHLREMTGLTIRATVSQLNCSAPDIGVFTSRALDILPDLPSFSPAKAPASRNTDPVSVAVLRQRLSNHNRFTTARRRRRGFTSLLRTVPNSLLSGRAHAHIGSPASCSRTRLPSTPGFLRKVR
jgi:hypothetical protein